MIEVPDMEGTTVHATVEEISSWGGDKAVLAVAANGRRWFVEMPLNLAAQHYDAMGQEATNYSFAIRSPRSRP